MIVFLTSAAHTYTVRPLTDGKFGPSLPTVKAMSYQEIFQAVEVPAATYIFTDMDRLKKRERPLATDLYAGLGEAGLRRLNDPDKVLQRYQLLRALHKAGINPFQAYRAHKRPRPERFPVILRLAAGHRPPLAPLLANQEELDDSIRELERKGLSMKFAIVVEYCAEQYKPGIWRRFGTFRIGDRIHTAQSVTEDSWLVKYGQIGLATEDMFRDSLDVVRTGRFVEEIRPAFEIAHIEYGRADHATVDGRQVIYEINTNPTLGGGQPRVIPPLLRERQVLVREMLAAGLWDIDTGDGGSIAFPRSDALQEYRPDPPRAPPKPRQSPP